MSNADRASIISELEEGMANSTLKNQRQLALAAGIKYTQLNDFMTNRSGMINAASLEKLRDAIARHRVAGYTVAAALPRKNEKTNEPTALYMAAKLSILTVAVENGLKLNAAQIARCTEQLHQEIQLLREQGQEEEPSPLAARIILKQNKLL